MNTTSDSNSMNNDMEDTSNIEANNVNYNTSVTTPMTTPTNHYNSEECTNDNAEKGNEKEEKLQNEEKAITQATLQ